MDETKKDQRSVITDEVALKLMDLLTKDGTHESRSKAEILSVTRRMDRSDYISGVIGINIKFKIGKHIRDAEVDIRLKEPIDINFKF